MMKILGIEIGSLKQMWKLFCALDNSEKGCVLLDQLFTFIKETHASIVAPFLERLYEIMVKQNDLYIHFDEFVSVISAYCLMTHEDLVSCIFHYFIAKKLLFIC